VTPGHVDKRLVQIEQDGVRRVLKVHHIPVDSHLAGPMHDLLVLRERAEAGRVLKQRHQARLLPKFNTIVGDARDSLRRVDPRDSGRILPVRRRPVPAPNKRDAPAEMRVRQHNILGNIL
jgi:hypothetical protein